MAFLLLLLGILRIIQANCNKLTSSCMTSTQIFFRYGAFFEGAAAVFSLLYLFAFGFYGFNTATIICAILSAFCYTTELITSLEALKHAPLVLCNMGAMGGGIVLVSILGIFFFDEPMTVTQWLGVAAFFLASCCLTPSENRTDTKVHRISRKGWTILVLNFLINGAASFLGKYFAVHVENGNPSLYSFLTYTVSSVLFLFLLQKSLRRAAQKTAAKTYAPLPQKLYLYGTVLGAACASIVYLVTSLSRTVPVVIINTVPSAISIIGCLFVGALIFKEKITWKKLLGVFLGILSVVTIV